MKNHQIRLAIAVALGIVTSSPTAMARENHDTGQQQEQHHQDRPYRKSIGKLPNGTIDEKLQEISPLPVPERIDAFSAVFMGFPYTRNPIVGSSKTPEAFIIDFSGLNCFTYLDLIVAGASSANYAGFVRAVMKVRYKDGNVGYTSRNHFFSDWVNNNAAILTDITRNLCPHAKKETRTLNRRYEEGRRTTWVEGIPSHQQTFWYIPTDKMTGGPECWGGLRTGDMVGFVPRQQKHDGLDVLHTGIVIMESRRFDLRHAAIKRGVVQDNFRKYLRQNEKRYKGVRVVRYTPHH